MKTVAFIPARGGSKGIPGKNIKNFVGEPLIVHSINHALNTDEIDDVFVSTDDNNIAKISENAGAKIIMRPKEISGDTATSESAIEHGIFEIEKIYKDLSTIVFLQATSPLRPKNGLSEALKRFKEGDCDTLLSISPTHRFFWNISGEAAQAQYDFINRPRRQDMTKESIRYVENGSVYVFSKEHFNKVGNRLGGKIGYVIFDEDYSYEIDTPTDFEILEKIALNMRMK